MSGEYYSKTRCEWNKARRLNAQAAKRMWVIINALEHHGVPDTEDATETRIEWQHDGAVIACIESFPTGVLYRLRINGLLYPFTVEDGDHDKAALAIKEHLEKYYDTANES